MPFQPKSPGVRSASLLAAVVGVMLLLLVPSAVAGATEEPAESGDATAGEGDAAGPSDEVLINGAAVYSQTCSACHQPGGVGISGQFPPLRGNPNVEDADYLVEVIANGREGTIEVLGETYDGRMPAFSTLSEPDVADLVTYIQSGFAAPAGPAVVPGAGGATSDGALPDGADFISRLGLLIAVVVGGLVLAPRLASTKDRRETEWLDAWLKTGVIVAFFVIFTVFVPSWAMQTDTILKLDPIVQDLVGAGLWFGALVVGILALHHAHRQGQV